MQHLVDLLGELARSKGLLEQRSRRSRVALVSGDEQHACAGMRLCELPRELRPADPGHDDVGHHQIDDRYYVIALEGTDKAAARDEDVRLLIESGVAGLDKEARAIRGKSYIEIPEEESRVMLLNAIQDGEFFQKIRGNLITGLYNNPNLWLKFGYEGESASKGGYLNRGFDDVDWV